MDSISHSRKVTMPLTSTSAPSWEAEPINQPEAEKMQLEEEESAPGSSHTWWHLTSTASTQWELTVCQAWGYICYLHGILTITLDRVFWVCLFVCLFVLHLLLPFILISQKRRMELREVMKCVKGTQQTHLELCWLHNHCFRGVTQYEVKSEAREPEGLGWHPCSVMNWVGLLG